MSSLPPLFDDLFDSGIDPLDDAVARQWLLDHPDALPAFARYRESLMAMADATEGARPSPSPRRRVAALAAVAMIIVLTTVAGSAALMLRSASVCPSPDFASPLLVRYSRGESSVAGSRQVLHRTVATGRVARQQRVIWQSSTGATPAVPVCARSLKSQQNFDDPQNPGAQ